MLGIEQLTVNVAALVTVNEQVAVLPDASVALYAMTVVEPFANVEPGAGPDVCSTDGVPQLSLADGALHEAVLIHADNIIFDGQDIVGFCISFTVTVNEQVAVLPPASVTLKVFVVVPTGNVDPLARPAIRVVTEPEQLSVPTGAV